MKDMNKNTQPKDYIPTNKGQFTLEPLERELLFEKNRGSEDTGGYKEYRKKWFEYPEKQEISNYPIHVDVELASVCNLKCPMCYTITPEFKKMVNATLMDYTLYTKIIDECVAGGVYSIRLSFRGESFLHKKIVECIKYAKQKGIKEISTLTNGLKLDEKMFEEIMPYIDWITISFDGIGETYEQIRKPAKFDRAVEKIKNYQQIKKNAGRVKPVIKVQTVLPAIENCVEEFYNIFAPITDMVSANPLIDFHQDIAHLPKVKNFVCPQIYHRLVIGADGLAMMCMNDTETTIVIGDANKQSLHEIWHGEKMTEIRQIHKQHEGCAKLKPCTNCYLPLETYPDEVAVGERLVIADKYKKSTEKISELNTPEKYKRENLKV